MGKFSLSTILLLGLLTFGATVARAQTQNIFIAATSVGAGTGADCADALPYTFFNSSGNWASSFAAGKISPGTSVQVCPGTITASAGANVFSFKGSGTSGHPITLLFQPGATITAPYWACSIISVFCATGEILASGVSNIIINGAIITATANGTLLANQQNAAGIVLSNCANCTVENNTITNGYVHSCAGTVGGSTCNDTNGGNTFGIQTVNSNPGLVITGNTITHAKWAVYSGFGSGTTTGYTFSNNTCSFVDHCLFLGDQSGGSVLNGAAIFGNNCSSLGNWDTTAGGGGSFHHDCWHLATSAGGSVINSPLVYSNIVTSGTAGVGVDSTSAIYIAGGCAGCTHGEGIPGAVVFNNVLSNAAGPNAWGNGTINMYGSAGTAEFNTIVGFSNSAAFTNICIFTLYSGTTLVANICQFQSGITFNDSSSALLQSSDYNIAYNTGSDPFHAASAYYTLAAWQACASGCQNVSGAPDLHGSTRNPLLNASSSPPYQLLNSGSSAWQKGPNLTSTCATIPALCFDALGVARPPTGPWDIGAFESSATGAVTLTPSLYTFATTVVGQPSSDSPSIFTLANSSGSPITSISISFTGANAGDFSQTTSCGSSLANGSNCSINVSFTPAAIGPRTAVLSVAFSGSGSPQTSSLIGIAVPSVTNPSPANPVTFSVLVTDPSVPSTEKDEKYTEDLFTRNIDHLALVGLLH